MLNMIVTLYCSRQVTVTSGDFYLCENPFPPYALLFDARKHSTMMQIT